MLGILMVIFKVIIFLVGHTPFIKYFLGCIVCISSGYLNLIWFILAHVIYTCNSCHCFYALVGEIKVIYLFIL